MFGQISHRIFKRHRIVYFDDRRELQYNMYNMYIHVRGCGKGHFQSESSNTMGYGGCMWRERERDRKREREREVSTFTYCSKTPLESKSGSRIPSFLILPLVSRGRMGIQNCATIRVSFEERFVR